MAGGVALVQHRGGRQGFETRSLLFRQGDPVRALHSRDYMTVAVIKAALPGRV